MRTDDLLVVFAVAGLFMLGWLSASAVAVTIAWSAFGGALLGVIVLACIYSAYYWRWRCKDPEAVFDIAVLTTVMSAVGATIAFGVVWDICGIEVAFPIIIPGLAVFLGVVWSTRPEPIPACPSRPPSS